MRWGLGWVVVAGCWMNGDEPAPKTPAAVAPAPKPPPAPAYDFKMTRTQCLGRCPAYEISVDHDGHALWNGIANVQVVDEVKREVPAADVQKLVRAADAAHFFELDSGKKSSCTDTPHAIVTVTRDGKAHTVNDAQCGNSDPKLVELEKLIDDVAETPELIGH